MQGPGHGDARNVLSLSDEDLEVLEARFKDKVPMPVVLGMLAAVASAPKPVPTGEWLERLSRSLSPAPRGTAVGGDAASLLGLYQRVAAALAEGNPLVPPAEDRPATKDWCFGYLLGSTLDPTWGDGDEDHSPYMVIASIARVEETKFTRELDADPSLEAEMYGLVGRSATMLYRAYAERRARSGVPG